jgi:two-component system, LytTR family, sensor kinase
MFSHKLRYLFILILGSYSYLNTIFSETYRYYGIHQKPVIILAVFVATCLLIWEGNRVLEKVLAGRLQQQDYQIRPLLLFFGASHLVAVLAGGIIYGLIVFLRLGADQRETELAGKLVILFAFRINLFLNCIHAIIFLLKRYRQKEHEAEELREISTQASLQAIKNQVNPHFLFNNLNVLSALVMQKNEEANTFIEKFSTVYRYILKSQEKSLVSVAEELEFIQPYLYLLEKRFGEGLKVKMDIPRNHLQDLIVPVALQMLIENAIKHNIVSSRKPLVVRIFVDPAANLVVYNSFQPRLEKEPSTQVGLNNINQRLKMLTGQELCIHTDADTFSVGIPLIKSHPV